MACVSRLFLITNRDPITQGFQTCLKLAKKSELDLCPRRIEIKSHTKISTGILNFILPKTKLTNNFVYLSLKHDINQLVDKQTGGAQQHINRNDVVTFKFALPPEEVIQAFEEIVAPIFDSISELS
jgi:restriction endonuclease S subunit